MKCSAVLVLVGLICFCVFEFWAFTQEVSAPMTVKCQDISGKFNKRIEAFVSELPSSEQRLWEGKYIFALGIDEASELFLSKKQGFAYRTINNRGYSNFCWGSISETESDLILKCDNDLELPAALSAKLILVRAAQKVFVIPRERIHGFFLDLKTIPQWAEKTYFSKRDESNIDQRFEVVVPEQYKTYVNLPEMRGEVVEIYRLNQGDLDFPLQVKIDIGKKSHVFEGMKFELESEKKRAEFEFEQKFEFQITKVQDESSRAILLKSFGKAPLVSVGNKVTTSRFPWPDL